MAFKLAELFTEISVRDVKFKKSLTGINAKLRRTEQRLKTVAKVARNMFLVGAAAAGYFVKKASDVEEMASKFEAVFKEQSGAAKAFADELAKSVNRSTFALQGFLATMQDTFVPLGFARDKARELSQQIVGLAVDLASFNNAAEPDVLRAFQSAIVGNHETMRQYGVIITQTRLDQELLNMGFNKISRGATEQQKVLARLNLIMQGTSDAQGDAARTAGSFENQMKGLAAQLEVISIQIGKVLMPIARDLVKTILDNTAGTAKWIKDNQELIIVIAKWSAVLLVVTAILPNLLMAGRGVIVMLALMNKAMVALATGQAAAAIPKLVSQFILLAPAIGLAVVAVGVLVYVFSTLAAASIKAKRAMRELNEETARFNATMKAIRGAKDLASVQTAIKKTREQIKQAADDVKEWAEKRTVWGGIDANDALLARQARRREIALSKTLGNLLQKEKEFLDNKEALTKGTGTAKGPIAAAKRIQDFLRKQRETDTQREIREVREKYKKFLEIAKKAGEQEGTLSARLAKQQAEDISQIRSKAELKEVEKKIAAEKAAKSKREGQAADVVKPALVGLEDMWRRLSTTGKENKSEAQLADIAKSNQKLTDLTARANEILERIASGATAGTAGMVGA